MSSLKQEISSAFASVDQNGLPATIVSQIAALSTSLRLSPKQLAESWEAHSMTKGVDDLNDRTFNGYRSALAKESKKQNNNNNTTVINTTGLGKRVAAPGSNVTPLPAAKRVTTVTATPGIKIEKSGRDGLSAVDNLTTPSGRGAVSPSSKGGSASAASSAVITPVKSGSTVIVAAAAVAAAPPVKYADRTNAGQLVTSYNPHNLPTTIEVLASKSTAERDRIVSHRGVTISHHPAGAHPRSKSRHMFAPLEKRSAALEERLVEMSDAICGEYQIKSEEDEMVEAMEGNVTVKSENKDEEIDALWTPVGLPKQNKVLCVGRICNEAHEGRLNRASIRLEGSRQHSAGSRIQLDLQTLTKGNAADDTKPQSYSFFPGQIVAVEGINSSGRTMQASRLLEGVPPPQETMSAEELLDYHYGAKSQNGAPLSIVSMCGPYTTKDNLEYEPLMDAISTVVMQDQPDVVIMCGPFVDGRQPLVSGEDGSGPLLQDEDGNYLPVSHEFLFAKRISELLAELYEDNPETKTQFVLVPSMDDAFLDAVYPQAPFEDRKDLGNVKVPRKKAEEFGNLGLNLVESIGRKDTKQKRVHCVSNPCTLQINDVTIGVTSTDVLFHISSDECNANLAPGTRLTRIAQHLVQQQSYYPLFPAAKGASLDLSKAKEWEMPVRPDILITPSKLASFARLVADTTIVVNPGELSKNTTGGTYATVDVHPMKRETLESGLEAGMTELGKGVQDRVRVDIKRI